MQWLKDEEKQAEDRDEKEEVVALYELAVQDYRCACLLSLSLSL